MLLLRFAPRPIATKTPAAQGGACPAAVAIGAPVAAPTAGPWTPPLGMALADGPDGLRSPPAHPCAMIAPLNFERRPCNSE